LKRLFALALASAALSIAAQPVKTEIRKSEDGWRLYREGKPYFIRGAGGTSRMEQLAAYGGNSIRTWDSRNAGPTLDKAASLGLTVTLGLNVARERHGFNYDDTTAVKLQLAKLKEEVLRYRDHRAVIAWGIGNELNLSYSNPKVWDAVNEISKMIHELDPNHLTTTMLAGVNKKEIDLIRSRCPDIDLISVQVYGGLASVPQQIRSTGWTKAYMVTEWGPTGHWESPIMPWKAAVEETSSEKAAVYRSRYEASIAKDKACIGSYVFLWGQKQERTPTWYGLFTEAGEESEVVDVMHYLWSGKWPANRAPHIASMLVNGRRATDTVYLAPGASYPVQVSATDPDRDKLTYRWELLPESTDLKEGGDRESRPETLKGQLTDKGNGTASLKSPDKEGAYRLFVYITDGKNKVATGNVPFYVKGK
jgi:hypothetical protein